VSGLQAADALRAQLNEYGKADAALWRTFLRCLMDGAGETAMASPIGMALQLAIAGKIQGDRNAHDDASERRRKPSGGFPGRTAGVVRSRHLRESGWTARKRN